MRSEFYMTTEGPRVGLNAASAIALSEKVGATSRVNLDDYNVVYDAPCTRLCDQLKKTILLVT
jgi:hypothetical protein